MISQFVRLFKKTDLDELRAFQSRVLSLLDDLYPACSYEACQDPLTIKLDGHTLGLTNIHSAFLLGTQSESTLRQLVVEHFGRLAGTLERVDSQTTSWDVAAAAVRPQLMPAQFAEKLSILSSPFGGGVLLAYVIDSADTYTYILDEDLARWGIYTETVHERALANLWEACQDLQMQLFPGPNQFGVISLLDGFDAVRIVLPEVREMLAEYLGTPFYFGIPNRDFLICWANSCEQDFVINIRAQLTQDHDEQPYPLSTSVFEVSANGDISETEFAKSNATSDGAENN